jgi:hypothetical protein
MVRMKKKYVWEKFNSSTFQNEQKQKRFIPDVRIKGYIHVPTL